MARYEERRQKSKVENEEFMRAKLEKERAA